jgi:filamentous hemagglutinin family protein
MSHKIPGYWRSLLTFFLAFGTISIDPILAQVIPDNSLGEENSVVTPIDPQNERIDGGAIREENLLHSFQEFNVGEGREVSFANPEGIANIFSRVTGANPSAILGKLGVLGDANLYLINPNGILFGANASLDVSGSFVATTANSVLFQDGAEFSTINPQQPILKLGVPLGLQMGANPGAIVSLARLEMLPGKNFAAIGGDIGFVGSLILAPGGKVELGGLSTAGTIGIDNNGSFIFPNSVAKSDILLDSGSAISVRAGGGGSITINARNLEILSGSRLLAGMPVGLGSPGAQAGDITINASDRVAVNGRGQSKLNGNNVNSAITNVLLDDTIGKAGNIEIQAKSLFLDNEGLIGSSTFALGDSGNINLNVSDAISLNNEGIIAISVGEEAEGNAGNLQINAGSLSLNNESLISNTTFAKGNAGNINIKVRDKFSIENSNVLGGVEARGVGNGGNLNITASSLSLIGNSDERSGLFTTPQGRGNAGNISLEIANDIVIDRGSIASSNTVFPESTGNSGNITISTNKFSARNGTQLLSDTIGRGKAGELRIEAKDTIAIADSQISAGTVGNLANLINSNPNLDVSPILPDLIRQQQIGTGGGGDLVLFANSISLTDGTSLFTGTYGDGDAGNIQINATNSLTLTNGAKIISDTNANGNAGNIKINARDISLSGIGSSKSFTNTDTENIKLPSRISSEAFSLGKGSAGNLEFNASQLSLADGAILSVNNRGSENAGSIKIKTDFLNLDRGNIVAASNPLITSDSKQIFGGNIEMDVKDRLLMRNNSLISAQAFSNTNGGNVSINAPEGFIVAFPLQNNDIVAKATQGNGGNIQINAEAIFGIEPRKSEPINNTNDIDASSDFGFAGSVFIDTPDLDVSQDLVELPTNVINTNNLIANSCVVPSQKQQGTFVITGAGGLSVTPGEAYVSDYPTGDVRNLADAEAKQTWRSGDPIIEPQGVYRLANGKLMMSRECSR